MAEQGLEEAVLMCASLVPAGAELKKKHLTELMIKSPDL